MFTSFTGNTRRPRQVNLSGRKTNPFGTPSTGAGSQAAVDRAQQERAQRQRERDTLNATKKIQRVWRGHAGRRRVAEHLRQEWDAVEKAFYETGLRPPYDGEQPALLQLQRLLRFASVRNGQDLERIQHLSHRLQETLYPREEDMDGRDPISFQDPSWTPAYLKFEKLLLAAVQQTIKGSIPEMQHTAMAFIKIHLTFVAEEIPAETSRHAYPYYRTLTESVSRLAPSLASTTTAGGLKFSEAEGFAEGYAQALNWQHGWEPFLFTLIAPLKAVTGYTLDAYEAFGHIFMTIPVLSSDSKSPLVSRFRDALAEKINYKLLASALATSFKGSGLQSHHQLKSANSRLRLLGLFIYFHRYAHNFNSPEAYAVHQDFVTVVSTVLNSLPTSILGDEDSVVDLTDEDDLNADRVTQFLKEQVQSLVNQEGIGSLLAGSTQASGASEDEKVEEARQLANYALALLRFFPKRGDEIRMWLYIGPPDKNNTGRKSPAIRYFWEASKRSSVYATVFRDSRAAIELLKTKTSDPSPSGLTQHGFWQPAQQEINREAAIADEWRVILVFLELYTFVLKVTDDEEFFAAGQHDNFSDQVRDSGLPLTQVKDLTTFLKNLGFTLYFNAADITPTEERTTTHSGLNFYSHQAVETHVSKEVQEPSVGGVAGLSLDYVKGLVTGLLRMIYERDSRRNFLPADHWLMTSRFDMTGFIPAVVEEEESRHKIQDEDADDVDEEEDEIDDTPQLIGTSRVQQQRRLERIQRQQRKASRRRYLQAVAPRLEILQNMPFFIPFTTRVKIFREFVHLDMTKRRQTADPEAWRARIMFGGGPGDKHSARIRRDNEFEDAFEQFYSLGQGLKEPIQITFVDQFDAPEAGIDGGGVTKEFLTSVTNRAFMPTDSVDMFVENDQHLLYPNPAAVEEHKERLKQVGLRENSPEFRLQINELLHRYEFLGRIIGKCLYEGILVDVNFAPFFLRKWALTGGTGSAPNETGYRPTLNDLRDLDEELYQGLHKLKIYPGDVEDFSLNFTVTDTVVTDHTSSPKKTKAITKDLKPGGAVTEVTNQNRLVYISYMARHRLQNQPYLQTTAFLRGLSTMIQPSWLSMFNHSELQTLISGTRTQIDVEDLRRNTIYGGTYVIGDDGLEHPTIQLFWQIMKDISDDERRAVLKFVTSTPRAPLLGFGTLNPRFSIRDGGSDQERLPSTSTCVNLLKLPMYRDYNVLKEKLLYSVFSGAGFDLS